VSGYELEFLPGFESDVTSFTHSPVKVYRVKSGAGGKFAFDSSPMRLATVFYESAEHWGPEVIEGRYYHVGLTGLETSDILFWDRNQWMRDARTFSPIAVPLNADSLVYRVGRSAPPERLLEYRAQLSVPKPHYYKGEESWFSLSLLDGKIYEGRRPDCEIVGHGMAIYAGFKDSDEVKPYEAALFAQRGTHIQLARDSFLCEAPPDGYLDRIEVHEAKEGEKWIIEGTEKRGNEPWGIYFESYEKRVYGVLTIHIDPMYDRIVWTIQCRANPRGSRNLNNQKVAETAAEEGFTPPIRPPITLPFIEPPK
jgi:hypothetical protein